jgi:hypothetical protein
VTIIKTNELTGAALDWAVAKCEGMLAAPWLWGDEQEVLMRYKFSTNWAQGGPLIEREKINTSIYTGFMQWRATMNTGKTIESGPTPLIAAMRCYVASKMGDTVDVPDELTL